MLAMAVEHGAFHVNKESRKAQVCSLGRSGRTASFATNLFISRRRLVREVVCEMLTGLVAVQKSGRFLITASIRVAHASPLTHSYKLHLTGICAQFSGVCCPSITAQTSQVLKQIFFRDVRRDMRLAVRQCCELCSQLCKPPSQILHTPAPGIGCLHHTHRVRRRSTEQCTPSAFAAHPRSPPPPPWAAPPTGQAAPLLQFHARCASRWLSPPTAPPPRWKSCPQLQGKPAPQHLHPAFAA